MSIFLIAQSSNARGKISWLCAVTWLSVEALSSSDILALSLRQYVLNYWVHLTEFLQPNFVNDYAVSLQCLRTLVGHTGGVWSSQMRDNIIISGSTDRTLKVWNAETGECIHTLYGHTSTVRCMHLHEKRFVVFVYSFNKSFFYSPLWGWMQRKRRGRRCNQAMIRVFCH